MKYFFGYFGFSMLISAFAASFMEPLHSMILFGIILFASIGFRLLSEKLKDFSLILAAVAVGLLAVSVGLMTEYYPAKHLDGMRADITGTVQEVSVFGGNPVFIVKTDYIGIEGAPQKIKIKLSGWDENSAKPFDRISCRVSFITSEERKISGILSDRSGKISVYAFTEEPLEIIGNEHDSFGYAFYLLRENISSVIYDYFISWHAPFMEQILIGTRGELDYEITTTFRQSGMSHILAVSGMHIAVILNLFEFLFVYRKTEGVLKKTEIGILISIVLAYMLICGMGASVIRAGGMFIVHYLIRLFLYGSKTIDDLGIAVAAVLICDPFSACDAGFIMSAVSCCAISAFYPSLTAFIAKFFGKYRNFRFVNLFSGTVSVSVIGFLAVLPVSAVIFGEIYPAGIMANIFASVLVSPILVLGFVTVLLGNIPVISFLAGGTAAICMIFGGALFKLADFFAFEGDFMFEVSSPWVVLWLLGSAVLIIVPAAVSASAKYISHSFAVSFFVLCGGFLINTLLFSGTAKAEVFVLEHGTAVSCSKDGNSVLVASELGDADRYYADFGTGYDVFISLDANSGAEEIRIADSSKAAFVMLSDEDAVFRCENAVGFDEGQVFFGEELFVDIISEGVFCIDAKEISLLYISEECDIMNIEPKFRKADIIIFDGVSPADYPSLRCEFMILRKTEGFFSGAYEIFTLKEGSSVFFGYNDTIKKGWLSR